MAMTLFNNDTTIISEPKCFDMNNEVRKAAVMFLRNAIGRILADRDIKKKVC